MSNKVRILIVEDEYMISEDIAMRLEDFGYEVAGIVTSAKDALEILNKGRTDLALLDVNIEGEIDGIELAKQISKDFNIPFIFLTSLANKAVVDRAKECNPSAYLLKPFNDRQVQISIEMGLENFSNDKSQGKIQETTDAPEKPEPILKMLDSLFLKKDFRFERVRFNEIKFLAAEGNYTKISTINGNYTYASVLRKFESKLPENMFARVHRSYIVNPDYISGFEGNCIFVGDYRIPVRRSNRDEVFRALRSL